jgi:hypothetical protein
MEEKQKDQKGRWSWLPTFMPGVMAQVAERRARHGAAWVAQCWQRGVVEGLPGWFWAAEGPLTVGTPIDGEVLAKYYAVQATFPKAVMLDMKEPPHAAG